MQTVFQKSVEEYAAARAAKRQPPQRLCRGCDRPPVPGYVNCAACLEERGNH